ncbi:MAG: magnesium transport protein CorA [Nitrosomonas sp.]|nr:MAG: magnesium transport protein CorA [Nitrosomonas sp.]
MQASIVKISDKAGLPPGSLVHVGDILESKTKISLIDYSRESFEEKQIHSLDEILDYKHRETITWVIIEGLANVKIVGEIGKIFAIHPLVLEDILNTNQRPKFEEYDDYLFLVLKSCQSESTQFSIVYEQISLLILDNFVFTFKEKTDDLLSAIVQRISTSNGRFRSLGTDYLAYVVLDTIVDQNFILMDRLDETITSLEDSLLAEPTRDTLNAIQKVKRELITIRRYLSPVRELIAELLRSESGLIRESTQIYFRDVSDHTIRVIELIESYRDILSNLLDIYVSNTSNRLNEVMKVLTVFASIFIPLTFLTGIYGMNFEHMPELKWKWAYPALWIAFITIPIVLIVYFKRKKWL